MNDLGSFIAVVYIDSILWPTYLPWAVLYRIIDRPGLSQTAIALEADKGS